jgi:hypothetical protein
MYSVSLIYSIPSLIIFLRAGGSLFVPILNTHRRNGFGARNLVYFMSILPTTAVFVTVQALPDEAWP